ncbi:hypothetical protein ACJMK2_007122 [Sinanodonta woodiana]|uniref:G8 domain-containing protein n=1 Tax=Sinanodonta woodiana TaxID=1069815 RepID=A0ABD3VIL7_SINWO
MTFSYRWFQILMLVLPLLTYEQTDAAAMCPHEDTVLKPWSDPATWPAGKKPTTGGKVTIDTPILMDEPSVTLTSITVLSTGMLVFNPDVDITLTLNYWDISGAVHIGSESCLYQGNLRIILAGKRGDFPWIGKTIIVNNGGILEVHGKRKLSWTKLDGTLQKLTKSNGIIYDHSVDGPINYKTSTDALLAYVFEINAQNNPAKKKYEVFDFNSTNYVERQETLRNMITELANGEVLLFSLRRNMIVDFNLAAIYNAFETLAFGRVTGTSKLRALKNNKSAYAALLYKTSTGVVVKETLTSFSRTGSLATVDLTLWDKKLKFLVESFTDSDEPLKAKQNFFIFTTSASYPIITLIDYVNTWEVGDRIVISSTDYDWTQVEEGTIVECSTCNNKQVKIDLPPRYTHWGSVEDGVVDMRAEVALLSRNIVIEGKMEESCYVNEVNVPGGCSNFDYDTYGGNIKFEYGFQSGRIEGVELYHMGQQTDLGSYPLHFHMCQDTTSYAVKPYLKENSIHHSFARCITLHGTYGILAKDNVCYRSLGHSYFLEDGGEKHNVLDGNLAIGTLKGKLLQSDSDPAAYWMTNPLNSLINNAGAGGEGKGIWYVYPDSPIAISAPYKFMAPGEASHTAITLFKNNVVHGYEVGLFIENKLDHDGVVFGTNDYKPLEVPTNTSSPEKKVQLIGLTAYNNWNQNAFVRGGWIEMSNSSFLGSLRGLTYASSGSKEQFIKDSVFIGESNNLGEPSTFTFNGTTVYYNRSVPMESSVSSPRQGFVFNDGPVYADNIWFKGYKKTSYYNMGAIGFLKLENFSSSTVSSMTAAKFAFADGESTGNRVIGGDPGFGKENDDKTATFQDADGSVSGVANNQIVKPYDYYVTEQCKRRVNWEMAICPHDYGKIRPTIPKTLVGIANPIMTRIDNGAEEQLNGVNSTDFVVILRGVKRYMLHWSSKIPNPLEIYSDGIEKDKWVVFGVCLPRAMKFDLYSNSPFLMTNLSTWTAASSFTDLENTVNDGRKYYYDSTNSVLYFKFINQYDRQPGETRSCPNNHCPMVKITLNGTNDSYPDADCRVRLNINKTAVTLATDTQSLTSVFTQAPELIGARITRPFADRGKINGGWSNFGPWGICLVTNGSGIQKRYRSCNNPIPHNGDYCVGSVEDVQACTIVSGSSHHNPTIITLLVTILLSGIIMIML